MTSEKVEPFFPVGLLQTEVRVPFLQNHLFDTMFRPSRSFFGKRTDLYIEIVNLIPGRNLLVLNFAHHLPKP